MPTYHYACSSCANEFDKYQTYAEDALTVCPVCEGRIRRVIGPVGVVFKGSGWYLTDSRKPEKSAEPKPDSATDAKDKPAATTDTKPGDNGKADKPDKLDKTAKPTETAASKKSVESKTAKAASS